MEQVFVPAGASWRGLGVIPESGMALRPELRAFDAASRFELPEIESYEIRGCRCGEVIIGRCEPAECGLFGGRCTPRDPVGACMVSSEGACAAAYKYQRQPAAKDRCHKTSALCSPTAAADSSAAS
jgi:hydrogenase expression/formation protein HypD